MVKVVIDIYGINEISLKNDPCYKHVLELADFMHKIGWSVYYIAETDIENMTVHKRVNHVQLSDVSDIDVWISVGNELPDIIKNDPLSMRVAWTNGEHAFIADKCQKTENNDQQNEIECISDKYDYIVCSDDKDYEKYKKLFTPASYQCVIYYDGADVLCDDISRKIEKRNNKPLVTVVTVTYNLIKDHREEMINQCIKSVSKQTYENIEHIIIDGASDDGTLDLLKNYEKSVVIYSEKDNGVYDAMNKGISKAMGKYVAFLNSDDCFSDNRAIEYSVARLEMFGADYSFSDVIILHEDKTTDKMIANIDNLPYATHYCHQSMLVKTEILKKYHGFNNKYMVSADSDLMIRLYKDRYKHVYIPKLLIIYRDGGLSEKNREKSRHEHAYSFFDNIGKDIGLTTNECLELWHFGFLKSMPKEQRINLLTKVAAEFNVEHVWNRALKERSLIRKAADGLIDKKIIIIRRRKSGNKRLLIAYLGGKIPCFMKISNM